MFSRIVKLSLTILCGLVIIIGLGSRIYSYSLSISNYPLTTNWSESGRIFEAASIYAPMVFGRTLPWPWLDPGRAILDGLVLLIPNSQIWMYRFWLAFLGLSTTVITANLIIKKALNKSLQNTKKPYRLFPIFLISWGILFILQGPIYYHVLLGTIVVLWLFDLDKPILTIGVVIIASAWEGLCRVNWFLMPAVLVVIIYLLTVPVTGKKLTRYFLWPLVWVIFGTITSFITYCLFIKFSNYVIPFFNPEMHYGFFRYKLWPNSGFTLGLIPGITLLSAPVIILLLATAARKILKLHWIRLLSLFIILATFLFGSTIVSLRAGGGFDLHNYDTFILILFVVGTYWGVGAVAFDKLELGLSKHLLNNNFVLLGLLVVPVFFSLSSIVPRAEWPMQEANVVIRQVQSFVQKTDTSKGPILFIDYRHLLVYRRISTMELYLPYEKIDLMEMAIANNRPYLDRFWKEIEEHKFSLIVSENLQLAKQDIRYPFGFENNVWVGNVSEPILRYYDLVYSESGLAIFSPK